MATVRIPSSDGVVLSVHDLGGRGPEIVMAHATGFHGRVWEPLAAALTGFHCWGIDLRAHGDSLLTDGARLEWEAFADDILAVVDALELDRPFGVGHSKGGAALVLAEERRPGTFEALWLYEPVIMPPAMITDAASTENPLSEGARRRRPTFASRDEAFENFAGKQPFSALDPGALRAYVDHGFSDQPDGSVTLKCRPEHEARVYAMGSTHRASLGLAEVLCPVTVAVGHSSTFGPTTFADAIVAGLPQGHRQDFGDLGHFGPMEDPPSVARGIRQAFAGL